MGTTVVLHLRKPPKSHQKIFGIPWTMVPWPSMIAKAIVRKLVKREWVGTDPETIQRVHGRLAKVYAVSIWSAMGILLYSLQDWKVLEAVKEEADKMPFQEEVNMGGALYYQNLMKSPDDLADSKTVKVFKFKGGSYVGSEDITEKVQELGRWAMKDGGDVMLRKYRQIPLHSKGGPSPQELKEQIEAEGYDYDLILDMANRRFGIKTRYNEDGTVGEWISKVPSGAR